MMILIIVLTIIAGCLICISMYDWDMFSIAFIGILIEVIITAVLLGNVINGRVINDKIKMYQEENKTIETQIETAVKEYMKFENETFTELKTKESYITLVTLYPDLKSNELVKKEIEVYISNNNKIKELKETKINISNYKWWIWFGR